MKIEKRKGNKELKLLIFLLKKTFFCNHKNQAAKQSLKFRSHYSHSYLLRKNLTKNLLFLP